MLGDEAVRIVDIPGNDYTMDEALDALTVILNRSSQPFNEQRWGTESPSFATQAMWMLPYRQSARSMKCRIDIKKLMTSLEQHITNVDDRDEFKKRHGTRLQRCFDFHSPDSPQCGREGVMTLSIFALLLVLPTPYSMSA